ncbi:MAG: hypothetical protein ACC645_20430 [Pirellulales bacterium]
MALMCLVTGILPVAALIAVIAAIVQLVRIPLQRRCAEAAA